MRQAMGAAAAVAERVGGAFATRASPRQLVVTEAFLGVGPAEVARVRADALADLARGSSAKQGLRNHPLHRDGDDSTTGSSSSGDATTGEKQPTDTDKGARKRGAQQQGSRADDGDFTLSCPGASWFGERGASAATWASAERSGRGGARRGAVVRSVVVVVFGFKTKRKSERNAEKQEI